jgi:CRISPR-associated endonuclease/helicase Cas3
MEYFSHPQKPWIVHSEEVYNNANKYFTANNEQEQRAVEIVSKLHDFGKLTSYFQKHLLEHKKEGTLYRHGFLSALYTAHTAFGQLDQEDVFPLFLYHVVLHHHGNIENLEQSLPSSYLMNSLNFPHATKQKLSDLKKQIADMKKYREDIFPLLKRLEMEKSFDEFLQEGVGEKTLARLKKVHRKIYVRATQKQKEYWFYFHQRIYAALIDADKYSASGTKLTQAVEIPFDLVENKRQTMIKNNHPLNILREAIYQEIQQNIKQYFKHSIFSITAPTGTGKTFSGFMAALQLRQKLPGTS